MTSVTSPLLDAVLESGRGEEDEKPNLDAHVLGSASHGMLFGTGAD
jgi:hypothetical protein